MGVNLVIAVTDKEWFTSLRNRPGVDEVNFWSPSPRKFGALKPGELFLFKLHSPDNFIVGGGIFAYGSVLPVSLAWQAFREGNGADSAQEMRTRIIQYRQANAAETSDFEIGCRILTQPFFLNEADWIPVPASWSPNIVTLKKYSTDDAAGRAVWTAVADRRDPVAQPAFPGIADPSARFGGPQLIRPRLGQGTFRVLVTESYNRRCAVTQERTLPALDAAHIKPYGVGGEHDARNGLLLRRDIHSLFDTGYVTVTTDLNFEVSRRIKEEFENGRHYYELHGKRIVAPSDASRRPNVDVLRWHNDHVFRR